jgi:HCOMODA/2-hydroxy-3-carboxy-muconic semialdehyde decarboxylase
MSQTLDLVAAYRILAEHGVIDAYGHVSVRSERDPNRYLLAGHIAPENVTEEHLIEYDLDSNPLDARGRESVRERFIHGEVYKARPEVMSVVHSHSHTVVPFSVTEVPLRPVFHMAAFVGENLPRAVGRSIYLEINARMQMQAMAIAGPGGRITYIDDAEVRASNPVQNYNRAWPAWRERALARLRK